ncbi:hypothetical protein H0H93_011340, partial [Arthromyces matolae]
RMVSPKFKTDKLYPSIVVTIALVLLGSGSFGLAGESSTTQRGHSTATGACDIHSLSTQSEPKVGRQGMNGVHARNTEDGSELTRREVLLSIGLERVSSMKTRIQNSRGDLYKGYECIKALASRSPPPLKTCLGYLKDADRELLSCEGSIDRWLPPPRAPSPPPCSYFDYEI